MGSDLEGGGDGYTKDGTVDLDGNPVLRSKRGGWTACSFVVVYEVFERMAYYGISSNLVIYLTTKLHQGTVSSSNNVTNWVGTIWITPILGAYVADAHLGRYLTFVTASAIYLAGMALLTMSVSLPGLKPPSCHHADKTHCEKASTMQLAVFYGALYTLAVGTGGTKPNISTIGADQFDEYDLKEKHQKLSFFNWWMFSIFFGTLFANTVLVYIQDNVGWSLGYGLPTIGLAISIAIFLAGTPFYRHRVPAGSPFTKMARVIVAALRKRSATVPNDRKGLYELESEEYTRKGSVRIDLTPSLRWLTKAAVKTGPSGPWQLCTVTQVEETKQMLRMIPVVIVTFVPSTMVAQIGTLFVKQGTTLDRSVGSFTVPPASLAAFVTISMLVSVVLYDRFFVPFVRRWTKNPRGITILQRMCVGLVLHIGIMVTSALVEKHRLRVVDSHGLSGNPPNAQVPLSIFVLLPQFMLMGTADAFLEVAKIEFFYDQAPEGMKSLGTAYGTTSLGAGNFISSFLLSTVSRVTKTHDRQGWIRNNLNASRLDLYYLFLATLNVVNLFFFLLVAKTYVYKAEISDSMMVLAAELKGVEPRVINDRGDEHPPPMST